MSDSKSDWNPQLNAERKLMGPLPEVVDLCDGRFPTLNFDQMPMLVIADDTNVRSLRLPADVIGVSLLIIRNLPALQEVSLIGDSDRSFDSFQWIDISEVPALRRVSLAGRVVSLNISGSPLLEHLNVGACSDLVKVTLADCPSELRVNVRGCLKLRAINDVSGDQFIIEGLEEQIADNQTKSRNDGVVYDKMTYTDIDQVQSIINDGLKAISRSGRLHKEAETSLLGRFDLGACEPWFEPLGYRLLAPLEPVYTGGTGETYAYVFVEREIKFERDEFHVSEDEGAGNSSPENCLRYMLHWIRMDLSDWPEVKDSSDDELLQVLTACRDRTPMGQFPGLPIRLSSWLDERQKRELQEMIAAAGMTTDEAPSGDYAYVHPDSGVPSQEEPVDWRAMATVKFSAAIEQLERLRQSRCVP